jgi:hypothetical protein
MSKATEARVRDELLQTLYSHVLRCTLASAASGLRGEDSAAAAGVFANLHAGDTILLPARHAAGFRVLRGLSVASAKTGTARDRAARVYALPPSEAQAVAFCLAMGMAAADAPATHGSAVVVVLPPRVHLHSSHARGHKLPSTWEDAAAYAARTALPMLFVSVAGSPAGNAAVDPSLPAPLYPSIPVDRADALAAYRVAFECLGRARAGGGPSHLFAGRYPAPPGIGSSGISGSALTRLEAMLRKRGCYSKAWQRTLEREITRELAGQP